MQAVRYGTNKDAVVFHFNYTIISLSFHFTSLQLSVDGAWQHLLFHT